jgi:ectoine hydroxylase-related dioxygenase (phytanoyl-CoA dioxygenase family)
MTATIVSDADISRYREDGVACLRSAIPLDWIERLRTAIDADIADPGPMKRITTSSGQSGFSFLDFQLWQRHDACRSFVFESPAVEIVARLMGSREVVLYHDRLRVKEPGTPEGQAWHHDQPYYPIDGSQIVSLWLPLDAASRETCVEYIRGSHLWGRWFQPTLGRAGTGADIEDPRFEALPDIKAERERHEFLSWDVEPGDVVAFHGLTLHGAATAAVSQYRCSAWETRWCGDDARYAKRLGRITPVLEGHGLAHGDPLSCALFPKVWPR